VNIVGALERSTFKIPNSFQKRRENNIKIIVLFLFLPSPFRTVKMLGFSSTVSFQIGK